MRRIILFGMVFAMVLCLFAGCKAKDAQQDSAFADDLIEGSFQEPSTEDSEGLQKEENQAGNKPSDKTETPQSGNSQQVENSQQSGSSRQENQGENSPQSGSVSQSGSADQEPQEEDPYAAMKADTSGTKVKIICQNLRLDSAKDQGTDNDARIRRYRFKALVEKYDPDIIACQEADPFWLENLPMDYGSKYGIYYMQRGVISGGSTSDEACPILWKKDQYTKLDAGYFWLSKTPNESSLSYEEGQGPRICNWVRLKDNASGVRFYILSTHYGFYENESSIEGIRNQMLNFFRKVAKDEYAFVMGDYNFVRGHRFYDIYADGVNMIDLRAVAEEMAKNGHCALGEIREGSYNAFTYPDGDSFGDHIMCAPRKKMTVDTFGYLYEQLGNENTGTPAGFISDHFAVYTELRLNTDISYEDYFGAAAK